MHAAALLTALQGASPAGAKLPGAAEASSFAAALAAAIGGMRQTAGAPAVGPGLYATTALSGPAAPAAGLLLGDGETAIQAAAPASAVRSSSSSIGEGEILATEATLVGFAPSSAMTVATAPAPLQAQAADASKAEASGVGLGATTQRAPLSVTTGKPSLEHTPPKAAAARDVSSGTISPVGLQTDPSAPTGQSSLLTSSPAGSAPVVSSGSVSQAAPQAPPSALTGKRGLEQRPSTTGVNPVLAGGTRSQAEPQAPSSASMGKPGPEQLGAVSGAVPVLTDGVILRTEPQHGAAGQGPDLVEEDGASAVVPPLLADFVGGKASPMPGGAPAPAAADARLPSVGSAVQATLPAQAAEVGSFALASIAEAIASVGPSQGEPARVREPRPQGGGAATSQPAPELIKATASVAGAAAGAVLAGPGAAALASVAAKLAAAGVVSIVGQRAPASSTAAPASLNGAKPEPAPVQVASMAAPASGGAVQAAPAQAALVQSVAPAQTAASRVAASDGEPAAGGAAPVSAGSPAPVEPAPDHAVARRDVLPGAGGQAAEGKVENGQAPIAQPIARQTASSLAEPAPQQHAARPAAPLETAVAAGETAAEPVAEFHATQAPAPAGAAMETRAEPAPVRGSPETVADLAADIARKLEGRNTRFEVALDPLGLGVVNVSIEIGADGHMSAQMAFERPEAAAELRGRAGELQRALEQAGFDLSKGGLSFEHGGGRERSGGDQPRGQQARAQAFQAALLAAETADTLPATPLRLRDRGGLDVRI